MFLESLVSGFADIRSISEGVHELYSELGILVAWEIGAKVLGAALPRIWWHVYVRTKDV